MSISNNELYDFLEHKYAFYNNPRFIESDPVQIPHQYSVKQDIEIAGLLTATIAWGQRKTIINNARRLLQKMGRSPLDFIKNASEDQLKGFAGFKHRTFNGEDTVFFFRGLRHVYDRFQSLEELFLHKNGVAAGMVNFRNEMISVPHLKRSEKHISNPLKGSSAKRLNMFLRWMVRNDSHGVDFGVWKKVPAGKLLIPLDIHSGNVARKLGLLRRKQNDWKAVEELTENLRKFDADDPVKYDFALFGLGVFEQF